MSKINIKKLIPTLLLYFFTGSVYAQFDLPDKEILANARKEVSMLCSRGFAGRGYTKNGHIKAAEYIARRFRLIGLQPPQKTVQPYFQHFTLNLNVVSDADVRIDGEVMEMGKDYILSPTTPASNGRNVIEDAGYGLTPDDLAMGCALLFKEGLPPEINRDSVKKESYKERSSTAAKIYGLRPLSPELIMVSKSKLTASFSGEQDNIPVLECVADSLSENPHEVHWHTVSELKEIETQNVIGKVTGAIKDTFVVISAHYDHLGQVGDAIFAGANDNASGVALLLALADYFVQNPPKYSILFIAFGAEETGLNGSRYYVENDPLVPLKQIRFILNLDLMGNGGDGIMAVGGVEHTNEFALLTTLNEEMKAVPIVKSRRNAPNSDHYFFLINGVRGFFVYTMGGPRWYHDVFDTPENLEFSHFSGLRRLFIRFIEGL